MAGADFSISYGKKFKSVKSEIEKLGDMSIVFGIVDRNKKVKGVKVSFYAVLQEYGYSEFNVHFPARSFFRRFLIEQKTVIKKEMKNAIKKVYEGKLTAIGAAKTIGEFLKRGIRQVILLGDFKPLAEYTVRKKGHSKPLIDTKTMYDSIGYEVYIRENIVYKVVGDSIKRASG